MNCIATAQDPVETQESALGACTNPTFDGIVSVHAWRYDPVPWSNGLAAIGFFDDALCSVSKEVYPLQGWGTDSLCSTLPTVIGSHAARVVLTPNGTDVRVQMFGRSTSTPCSDPAGPTYIDETLARGVCTKMNTSSWTSFDGNSAEKTLAYYACSPNVTVTTCVNNVCGSDTTYGDNCYAYVYPVSSAPATTKAPSKAPTSSAPTDIGETYTPTGAPTAPTAAPTKAPTNIGETYAPTNAPVSVQPTSLSWTAATPSTLFSAETPQSIVFALKTTTILPATTGVITLTASTQLWTADHADALCTDTSQANLGRAFTSSIVTGNGTILSITNGAVATNAGQSVVITCVSAMAANGAVGSSITFSAVSSSDTLVLAGLTGWTIDNNPNTPAAASFATRSTIATLALGAFSLAVASLVVG